ncbi:hypothetical protein [Legionella cardiaca]|uniref:Substrate of the Dot/Icm secretion system n=1 Tax=Legionella cardiaca TaxID=1071983 RepID=A0ABY8ASZ6_9GAMM|nr:hypothetical protein [Legionella cardiaca]WED43803.1 hypothetical protein PXX05_03210 [Legionella cardiaca]
MGYELPEYAELQKRTNSLLSLFNNLCGRYIPVSYEKLREKVTTLEAKYDLKAEKKTGWLVSTNKELRRDQVACINQLLPKLPTKGSSEELDNAHSILLGAIFYRGKRLEISYAAKTYGFFGYTAENCCAFYQVLLEEFNLKTVDDETLAKCCGDYQAYLKQPDINSGKSKTVGEQFPYIQEDPDFYKHLQEIVTTAKLKAEPITRQLRVIAFVQSVAKSLLERDREVANVLPGVIKEVTKAIKEKHVLSHEDLVEVIASISPKIPQITQEILKISLPAQAEENSVEWNNKKFPLSFEDYFSQVLTINSSYTLLGAYVMALGQCNAKTPKLRDALNASINSVMQNQLDNDSRLMGLKLLKKYISIPDNCPNVNFSAWNADTGEASMKMDLDIRLTALEVPSTVKASEGLVC